MYDVNYDGGMMARRARRDTARSTSIVVNILNATLDGYGVWDAPHMFGDILEAEHFARRVIVELREDELPVLHCTITYGGILHSAYTRAADGSVYRARHRAVETRHHMRALDAVQWLVDDGIVWFHDSAKLDAPRRYEYRAPRRSYPFPLALSA